MNSNTKKPTSTGMPLDRARRRPSTASRAAGVPARPPATGRAYRFESLKPSGSTLSIDRVRLDEAARVEHQLAAAARAGIGKWCSHCGQTLSFFSRSAVSSAARQPGHLVNTPAGTLRFSSDELVVAVFSFVPGHEPIPRAGEYHRPLPRFRGAVDAEFVMLRAVHFGVWHPISEASTAAPEAAGVLQTRAEGVMDYRAGRSAMVLYACTRPDETLRGFVAGRGARELDARGHGGRALDPLRRDAEPRARARPAARGLRRALRVAAHQQRRPAAGAPPRATSRGRALARCATRGSGLTYRDAGVDIDAGDTLVERIKPHVRRTLRPEVMTDLGGFAGLCALPAALQASRCWCRAPTAWAPS